MIREVFSNSLQCSPLEGPDSELIPPANFAKSQRAVGTMERDGVGKGVPARAYRSIDGLINNTLVSLRVRIES